MLCRDVGSAEITLRAAVVSIVGVEEYLLAQAARGSRRAPLTHALRTWLAGHEKGIKN